MDETFHFIIKTLITTGQAPNITEIADELGVSAQKSRKLLRKLFSPIGFPGWFQSKTDIIGSFAPFSNIVFSLTLKLGLI